MLSLSSSALLAAMSVDVLAGAAPAGLFFVAGLEVPTVSFCPNDAATAVAEEVAASMAAAVVVVVVDVISKGILGTALRMFRVMAAPVA